MFLSINWGNALVVTFFGFAIVLVVLILLALVLNLFGKMMVSKKKEANATAGVSIDNKKSEGPLTAAESAAVAMALYQYCNAHDEESHVLTLNNSEHPYHPWSSKIYGINNLNK